MGTSDSPHIAIISARRPHGVAQMTRWAPQARWYVAMGEKADYLAAGAADVVEAGPLVAARNAALDHAFALGVPCVQLSDDLRKLQLMRSAKTATDATLDECLTLMAQMCDQTGAYLAGVAPVANAFYFDVKNPVKQAHFIVGDFIYVRPSEPRFPVDMELKEDYDFTAQHLLAYGRVARCDFVQATFAHRTNKGGAVAYRTERREQEAIATLQARWGAAIRPNPRRPNEVLLHGPTILARREDG
jgi:hypothetical protein